MSEVGSPRSKREKKDKKEKKKEKKEGKKSARSREKTVVADQAGDRNELADLNIDSGGKANKVTVDMKDCSVQNVTVYNDRAEVTRTITATVQPGSNEVSVFGLSPKVDKNSVRVSGGKGSAIILEVSYNVRYEPKSKDDGTEKGRLTREKEELDDKIDRLTEVLGRIDKESSWVESWARTLSEPKKTEAGKEVTTLFSSGVMEQATNFLDFYQKKLADIDGRRADVEKSLKELREQRVRVVRSLGEITGGSTEQVNEVVVLLYSQAPEEQQVHLVLSYVVMDAKWYASYDVRVQSTSDELDLTYYGFIINNSADDWNDAPLALSTAQPSIGGAPPELTTKFVGFRPPQMLHSHMAWASYTNADVSSAQQSRFVQQDYFNPTLELAEQEAAGGGGARDQLQVMTSAVQESSICTSFTIPRKTTILSDNKPHKVTIRMIKLQATYTYVIIPKLSLHAYLKASILNTSENYPFLPGEINVFMDGNFVAKSNIKAVSPQESFSLFLGTDDAIRVTYPPGVFFKESQGLIRKSNIRTTKHLITIKNTKSQEIKVTVYDQLPKSNDSQIKVKLLKPSITEGDDELSMTVANNIKWKKTIAPGKTLQLPFEYTLEWPHGQELTM